MSFKSAQLQSFSLFSSGVSIGDTTITLSSFTTIDGVALTLADFGSAGYMTIEPGSRDREEQIAFYGVTQNSNGTATLTGIKTVLFLSPYTESSGFSKSHPGGAIAVVTNTSGFYNKLTAKDNNEVITGYWECPDPLANMGVANKEYVDNLVNGGTVSTNALIEVATAGETVSAGQVLYLKAADGRWWKADAATTATVINTQLGIAQGAGTAGNAVTGGVLIRGIDTHQSGISAGSLYYVRDGGGLPQSTAGTIPRVIGNGGISATLLVFDANFSDAANTIIGIQNESYIYAADSVGTDAYAITISPTPTTYVAGQTFRFKAGTANTAAATLAVNGGAAKAIKKNVSDDLNTGDILANQVVEVTYDGTNFQIQSKTPLLAPISRVYVANDTWSKPAGLKYVDAEVVGGGGGGGGNTTANSGSSGGGGGGYSRKRIAVATLGATETVTVGAAGAAGAAAGGTGGSGGTSSLGAHLTATGGDGGAPAARGGVGGVGASGDLNIVGQGGGGGTSLNGAPAGAGGSSYLGGGAPGNISNNTQIAGVAGSNYGGGGGGAVSDGADVAGGAGAAGVVIVTEYYA